MPLLSCASSSIRPSLSRNGFSTIAWGGGTPAKNAARLGLLPPQDDLILVMAVVCKKFGMLKGNPMNNIVFLYTYMDY